MKKRFILTTIMLGVMMFGMSITANAQTTIEDGATYWETSWNGGSGQHNTISDSNPYITEDREVIVNGYSFLDENGVIIHSEYNPYEDNMEIPESPEGTARVMLHIHSTTNRLGWIDAENIDIASDTVKDIDEIVPEEKTAEEFVDVIEEKEGKTLIYVDKSSSMQEFTEQATQAFYKLDLSDVVIVVFAEQSKEVGRDNINEYHMDIGGSTDIYGALNSAEEYLNAVENVVLISDLNDNGGVELVNIPSIKTVEILCPDPYYPEEELEKIRSTWANAEINLSIIK